MADDLGFDFPSSSRALKIFEEMLPSTANYGNPLDVTAGFRRPRCRRGQACSTIPISGCCSSPFDQQRRVVQHLTRAWKDPEKPKVMVALAINGNSVRRGGDGEARSGGV